MLLQLKQKVKPFYLLIHILQMTYSHQILLAKADHYSEALANLQIDLPYYKYQNHKDSAVQEVMDAIIQGPGMDYARNKMTQLRDEAMELLGSAPDSEAKVALIGLVDYTIERKR